MTTPANTPEQVAELDKLREEIREYRYMAEQRAAQPPSTTETLAATMEARRNRSLLTELLAESIARNIGEGLLAKLDIGEFIRCLDMREISASIGTVIGNRVSCEATDKLLGSLGLSKIDEE